MLTRVALVGATGKIGPTILNTLLDAGFEVLVLSRQDSNSTDSMPEHEHLFITRVNYTDFLSLTVALKGVEVVVSALSSLGLDTQQALINASVAAGVKRFIPSEFACDLDNKLNKALPIYPGKKETQEYIKAVAASHPNFSYTIIYNNVWLDWGIQAGFILDKEEHKATLWDGGDVPFSTTRLSTVAKTIVGVVRNQEATKNRTVYVHDAAITMNQLVQIASKVDGREWTTEVKSTVDSEHGGREELAKPAPDSRKAMIDLLMRATFGREHGCDFTGKTDNELLGLPVLEGESLIQAVRACL